MCSPPLGGCTLFMGLYSTRFDYPEPNWRNIQNNIAKTTWIAESRLCTSNYSRWLWKIGYEPCPCRTTYHRSLWVSISPDTVNISLCNVYEAVINTENRTTNVGRELAPSVSTNHSNIWKFFEHIKVQQNANEQLIIQLRGGHSKVKHPITSWRVDERIDEVIVD